MVAVALILEQVAQEIHHQPLQHKELMVALEITMVVAAVAALGLQAQMLPVEAALEDLVLHHLFLAHL